jgi:hypothetical protein
MIIQYILVDLELFSYLNMVSDIQKYKYNLFKNEKNKFVFKSLIAYIFVYPLFYYCIYYYTILQNKTSILSVFIFGTVLTLLWDGGLFLLFDTAVHHIPVLLFDTIVVGGLGVAIGYYIFRKYYKFLENKTYILVILYLLALLLFFYRFYKYNPDLSNIKGIVLW